KERIRFTDPRHRELPLTLWNSHAGTLRRRHGFVNSPTRLRRHSPFGLMGFPRGQGRATTGTGQRTRICAVSGPFVQRIDPEILLSADGFVSTPEPCCCTTEHYDRARMSMDSKTLTGKVALVRDGSRGPGQSANATSIVWVFVLLVVALTAIANYAVWEKAAGLTPFLEDGSTLSSNENTEHHAP